MRLKEPKDFRWLARASSSMNISKRPKMPAPKRNRSRPQRTSGNKSAGRPQQRSSNRPPQRPQRSTKPKKTNSSYRAMPSSYRCGKKAAWILHIFSPKTYLQTKHTLYSPSTDQGRCMVNVSRSGSRKVRRTDIVAFVPVRSDDENWHRFSKKRVLYNDNDIIVYNKPHAAVTPTDAKRGQNLNKSYVKNLSPGLPTDLMPTLAALS